MVAVGVTEGRSVGNTGAVAVAGSAKVDDTVAVGGRPVLTSGGCVAAGAVRTTGVIEALAEASDAVAGAQATSDTRQAINRNGRPVDRPWGPGKLIGLIKGPGVHGS